MPDCYELHCLGCPYHGAAHLPEEFRQVRSTPRSMENNAAPVLLIFQAPSVDEWVEGKPVVSTLPSSAGLRLEAAFQQVGKTGQNFNITNTVQCFLGKNLLPSLHGPRSRPTILRRSEHTTGCKSTAKKNRVR